MKLNRTSVLANILGNGNENNRKTKVQKSTDPLFDYNPKITIINMIFD